MKLERPKLSPHRIARGRRILDDFLQSDYFDRNGRPEFQSLLLSDPDRAERVDRAAEHGAEGSTHAEILQDQRDCWECYIADRRAWNRPERVDAAVGAALDEIEAWHEAAGSLYDEVG